MPAKITVHTKPQCKQCDMTKRWLDKRGAQYDVVDITQDEQALAAVQELGYMAAPVVIVNHGGASDVHWSGFQPGMLAEHIQEVAAT